MESTKAKGANLSNTFYLKKRGHVAEGPYPGVTARSTISNGTLNQHNTGGTMSAGDTFSSQGGVNPDSAIHERAISVNYRRSTVYQMQLHDYLLLKQRDEGNIPTSTLHSVVNTS